MRSLFGKMHKGEKGFTLVELLVVFTLLGLLAAIIIPNVSSFVSVGETEAAATEKSIVQTAMDCMMAVEGYGEESITPVLVGARTNDMSTFPAEYPLFPKYLRFQNTAYWYYCTDNGTVSQGTTAP